VMTSSARWSSRRTWETAPAIARAYFQASLIAQREGHYVLSRSYAQRAKELYQTVNDERNVGRLHLMLGGLTLLLGDEEHAVEHLKASYSRALDADSPADAAQALEGIARVHPEPRGVRPGGRAGAAVARSAAGSGGLPPRSEPSQLVLGRALLERGRLDEAEECFRAADAAAEQMASISHRTEAWVALGDLRRVAVTHVKPHVSTGTPLRRSRKSASREEVAMKPRLLSAAHQPCPGCGVARKVRRGKPTPGPTEARKTRLHSGAYAPSCGTDRAVVPAVRGGLRRVR
jgi:tetratricopeptide (TPR) repeat protein